MLLRARAHLLDQRWRTGGRRHVAQRRPAQERDEFGQDRLGVVGSFALDEGVERRVEDIGAQRPRMPSEVGESDGRLQGVGNRGQGRRQRRPLPAHVRRKRGQQIGRRLTPIERRSGRLLQPLPEPVVVGGKRQPGRIAVETVQLAEAVSYDVDLLLRGRPRFVGIFDPLGFDSERRDQCRRVHAAGDDDGRPVPFQGTPQRGAHVDFARQRVIRRQHGPGDGCAHRRAVGADVVEELSPVRRTDAALEQVVPQLVLIAAAGAAAQGGDVVAVGERYLADKRPRLRGRGVAASPSRPPAASETADR